MGLISYGTGSEGTQDPLRNNGFWPDIDSNDFRTVNRVDSSITENRAVFALRLAMIDVNRQLALWQSAQEELGFTSTENVPAPSWSTEDHYFVLYRQAVYATAHALLLERYRDHSATASGDERGDAKDHSADDYRRDARWAVAEITGRDHTAVELI